MVSVVEPVEGEAGASTENRSVPRTLSAGVNAGGIARKGCEVHKNMSVPDCCPDFFENMYRLRFSQFFKVCQAIPPSWWNRGGILEVEFWNL